MAGPKSRCQYTSDDGTAYCVTLPAWEVALVNHAATLGPQTCTPCTTQASLPRGYQRRKRMVRLNSGVGENGVTILSVTSNLWTAAIGAPVEVPLFDSAPPAADNATIQGAIGERRLNRQ